MALSLERRKSLLIPSPSRLNNRGLFAFEFTKSLEYNSKSFLIEFVTKTLTVVGDRVDSAMHVPAPEGHPFSHALVYVIFLPVELTV